MLKVSLSPWDNGVEKGALTYKSAIWEVHMSPVWNLGEEALARGVALVLSAWQICSRCELYLWSTVHYSREG